MHTINKSLHGQLWLKNMALPASLLADKQDFALDFTKNAFAIQYKPRKNQPKANEKENYLDEEERELLRNFIIKIKKELELNN